VPQVTHAAAGTGGISCGDRERAPGGPGRCGPGPPPAPLAPGADAGPFTATPRALNAQVTSLAHGDQPGDRHRTIHGSQHPSSHQSHPPEHAHHHHPTPGSPTRARSIITTTPAGSSATPAVTRARGFEASGRGLALVEALADRWGHQRPERPDCLVRAQHTVISVSWEPLRGSGAGRPGTAGLRCPGGRAVICHRP
jgi:hypothetical protein